jgi:hypothetical protein
MLTCFKAPLTQTEITAIDAAGALGAPKSHGAAFKWGTRAVAVAAAGALLLGGAHFTSCM